MNTFLGFLPRAKRGALLAALVSFLPPAFGAQPVITSVASALGVVDNAFTYQIEAAGAPTGYAATGLPDGLSINPATGVITGTASEGGMFDVELSATNADGTDTATLALTIGTVGTFASRDQPRHLAFDPAGNLAVSGVDTISKVTPAGAGSIFVFESFSNWRDLAYDSAGNLYAADNLFGELSKFTPEGVRVPLEIGAVDTEGIAVDGAGNVYFARSFDNSIGKITPEGVVSTFASGPVFASPTGMAFDSAGNLFVANFDNGTVTKVTPDGNAVTFASGFGSLQDVAFDPAGTLYVSGYLDGIIYKITPGGAVSTLVTGLAPFGPSGLAFDQAGALYVSNLSTNTIIRIGAPLPAAPVIFSDPQVRAVRDNVFGFQVEASWSPAGFSAIGLPAGLSINATTGLISGTPTESGAFSVALSATNNTGTGTSTLTLVVGTLAPFASDPAIVDPTALAFDPEDNLVVANFSGDILKVTPTGVVSFYVGGLDGATDIAYDSAGNLYVSRVNGLIHKITPSPLAISVFASDLSEPRSIAFDRADNLYVGEFDPNPLAAIRGLISRITPAGAVSTFASGPALPDRLTGLAFDEEGNLYASSRVEIGNSSIVKIEPDGSTSVFAEPVSFPDDLAFDSAGALYVDDNFAGTGRVQRITTTGIVGRFLTSQEPGPVQQFGGLAFDRTNDLYVATQGGIGRVSFPLASPVITSPTTATGTVGKPFKYTITATNGPAEFAAEGLPSGLVTNATTGAIRGVPRQAGSFSVDLAAGNGAGTGFAVLNLQIAPRIDRTAPVIAQLKATPSTLRPANHQLVAVTVTAKVTDNVGVTSFKIIKVTSSEPDQGLGGGDLANDIQITGDLTVNLRSERSHPGHRRTYAITVEARDAAGNTRVKTVTVTVPKNQGRR